MSAHSFLRRFLLSVTALIVGLGPPASDGQTHLTIGALKDNTLVEDPAGSLSNGAGHHFYVGRTNQLTGSVRRGLIAFDVAGNIPAGVTITSVTFTLNMSRTVSGTQTVTIHRALSDWGEGSSSGGGTGGGQGGPSTAGDATWIHSFFDTGFWANTGGDFAPTPSASMAVSAPGSYGWGSTAGMVADVQHWLDNPLDNYGWVVMGDESGPGTTKRFDSRENDIVSLRPRLDIAYVVNVGVGILADWNMISSPVARDPGTDSVRHLYPSSAFPHVFAFVPGSGYVQRFTMANGPGFWAKFPAAGTQTVAGGTLTAYSIDVVTGWNLVGSISSPVASSSISSTPPGLVASSWFQYSGGYIPVDTLFPGKGYWVRSNGIGQIHLNSTSPEPASATDEAGGSTIVPGTLRRPDARR